MLTIMNSEHIEPEKEDSASPTHSIARIKEAVEKGTPFDRACSLVAIKDLELREFVCDKALKSLVSEMHFSGGIPLKQLALKLGVSLSRVLNARERILHDTHMAVPDKVAGISGSQDIAR